MEIDTPPDSGEILSPSNDIIFECRGDISPETLESTEAVFRDVLEELKEEWALETMEPFAVEVFDNSSYRDNFSGPGQWKYNFLLKSPDLTKLYINTDIFQTIPEDVRGQIKHETAHIVINQAVGDDKAYKKSLLLKEGLAVPDEGVNTRLVKKIKQGEIQGLPNPIDCDNYKKIDGDTNKEPFTQQTDYLVIFSFCDFLIKHVGHERIKKIILALNEHEDLVTAYKAVTSEDLQTVVTKWQDEISEQL
ncbi:MAG: hypothetical protein PHW75_02235 [Patescibacteria group bacterium]|nr:hypothetical protein [Patescibacteria group bacterium]